ncbi:MAG: DivIVA domain-containing protein [Chloroflexi bacterium]|nr:DivIVA domain-containing protein [Chloroflexota bacterium]
MKLTPLDIHHKEFHRAIRGYNEEEVDNFLDQVAEEFERLFKDNIDLKEQVEKAKDKASEYEELQKTLQNTLITAQRSADEVIANAKQEAEQMIQEARARAAGTIQEAEAKAGKTIEEANQGKERVESDFIGLKNAETDFRKQFRSMLESYLGLVEGEMPKPETAYELKQPEPQPEPEPEPEPKPTTQTEETSFVKTSEAAFDYEGVTFNGQPAKEPRAEEEPEVGAGQSPAFGEPSVGMQPESKGFSDLASGSQPDGAPSTVAEPQPANRPDSPDFGAVFGASGFGVGGNAGPGFDRSNPNSDASADEPSRPTLDEKDEELRKFGWLSRGEDKESKE